MKSIIIKTIVYPGLLLLVFLIACNNPYLSNPFDPASDDFIPRPAGLLIDDFDNPDGLNSLNCQRETFTDSFNYAKIFVSFNSKPEYVLRGMGNSYKINFDVSKNDTAYCSFSDLLTTNVKAESLRGQFNLWVLGLDSIAYLQFWIKAESKNIDFEIALKGNNKDKDSNDVWTDPRRLFSQCDILGVKSGWQRVRIPIISLWDNNHPKEDVDNKSVREINFSFNHSHLKSLNRDLQGTIYLDEISFERE